jgi:hypothetical protein
MLQVMPCAESSRWKSLLEFLLAALVHKVLTRDDDTAQRMRPCIAHR